jgi:hypothetical protein
MLWTDKSDRPPQEDLLGFGRTGAHGGTYLSSIGGTIRLGELVPGGVIRHALQIDLNGSNYFNSTTRYRWPASDSDWCARPPPQGSYCYRGTNRALQIGALLALKSDFNFSQLRTNAAKILAHAFQDYGAYAVDNAGWSVYDLSLEFSPSGRVVDEFNAIWGFPFSSGQNTQWMYDIDRIFSNLHVVDNWDNATWTRVSASGGAEGAGGGTPRVTWAPPVAAPPP